MKQPWPCGPQTCRSSADFALTAAEGLWLRFAGKFNPFQANDACRPQRPDAVDPAPRTASRLCPALQLALGLIIGTAILPQPGFSQEIPEAIASEPAEPVSTIESKLDAELRFRTAASGGITAPAPGQDDWRRGASDRVRLGAQLRRQNISSYVQLQQSGALGDAGPGDQPLQFGMQQGFVRVEEAGLRGLRVDFGRMALEYGSARMIGRYDFHETGNAFDGLRAHQTVGDYLDADVLAVKIRRNSAHPDKGRNLFGLYATARPTSRVTADLYLLYLSDTTETAQSHDITMGSRIEFRPWSFLTAEAELAAQIGGEQLADHAQARDHLALAMAGSLQLDASKWIPLYGRAFSHMYSGDELAHPNVSSRWHPLYPSLDEIVGFLQIFAQANLTQVGGTLGWKPVEKIDISLDGRQSYARTGTTLPGFAGQILPGDGAWVRLGAELDLRIRWSLRPWSQLLLVGGSFAPSQDVKSNLLNQGRNISQVLLQWTTRF